MCARKVPGQEKATTTSSSVLAGIQVFRDTVYSDLPGLHDHTPSRRVQSTLTIGLVKLAHRNPTNPRRKSQADRLHLELNPRIATAQRRRQEQPRRGSGHSPGPWLAGARALCGVQSGALTDKESAIAVVPFNHSFIRSFCSKAERKPDQHGFL